MILFEVFPYAYRIELWAFACAASAVIVGILAARDAYLTRTEVGEDTGRESELYMLASSKVESSAWNIGGQLFLLGVAVASLLVPPPPVDVFGPLVQHPSVAYVEAHVFMIRLALSLTSLFFMIRDVRVMRVRSRILEARARRRSERQAVADSEIATLSQNISELNTTLEKTSGDAAAIERETLTAVKDAHQVIIETKDLAQAIDDKLGGTA